MSNCRLCLAALTLQTLLPFSSGAFFENPADALRELDIPVARSLHELKPIAKPRSDKAIVSRSVGKGTGDVRILNGGANYAIDITLGGKTYPIVFDTGSSAFFLPRANYTCLDYNSTVQPHSECGFAEEGPQDYTGGQVPNQNFQVTYISGEFATGTVGREDVTFAGLTVKDQHMALADRVYLLDQGDITTGIMGWGLGNYTAIFPGDDPKLNNKTDPKHSWIPTKTWIQNAVEQGLLEKPIFSMNLGQRTENPANLSTTGFVALGGAPLEGLPYTGVWAYSSVTPETYAPWGVKDKYTHWNVRPDGFLIDDDFVKWNPGNFAEGGNEIFTVIDSATSWSYITNETVQAIVNKMEPKPFWSPYDSSWVSLCNATVPKVSIRINGTDLPIAKREVLMDGALGQANTSTTLCWLGLQPAYHPKRGGTAPYILGTSFLTNVLAVHDLGNMRMAFASLKW